MLVYGSRRYRKLVGMWKRHVSTRTYLELGRGTAGVFNGFLEGW